MHVSPLEVAPLAPLLIPVAEVVAWFVALAVCVLVVYFAKAFFGVAGGTLGKLPVVGGWVNSGLHSVERKIVSTMSGAASACDAKLGAALHALARVVDWVGEEIARHANLINMLATVLLGTNLAADLAALERLIHSKARTAHGQVVEVIRRVHVIERTVRVGIGHDVLPRVGALERALGRVLGRDLPRVRAGERELGRSIDGLWKWTRRHTLEAGTLAFAGAVAWALSRIGIGWTRCNNWNRLGRSVCQTPAGDLEALLALALTTAAIADLQTLVREAQAIEHATAVAIQDVLQV